MSDRLAAQGRKVSQAIQSSPTYAAPLTHETATERIAAAARPWHRPGSSNAWTANADRQCPAKAQLVHVPIRIPDRSAGFLRSWLDCVLSSLRLNRCSALV
jgi:hypothetical protein